LVGAGCCQFSGMGPRKDCGRGGRGGGTGEVPKGTALDGEAIPSAASREGGGKKKKVDPPGAKRAVWCEKGGTSGVRVEDVEKKGKSGLRVWNGMVGAGKEGVHATFQAWNPKPGQGSCSENAAQPVEK